jgi:hypothetical protein
VLVLALALALGWRWLLVLSGARTYCSLLLTISSMSACLHLNMTLSSPFLVSVTPSQPT